MKRNRVLLVLFLLVGIAKIYSDPVLDLFVSDEVNQILDKGIFTKSLEKSIGKQILLIKYNEKWFSYDFFIDTVLVLRLNMEELGSVLRMSQFKGDYCFNILNPIPINIKIAHNISKYADYYFHQIYIVFQGNNEWQEAICVLIPYSEVSFLNSNTNKYYFIEHSTETIYWVLDSENKY